MRAFFLFSMLLLTLIFFASCGEEKKIEIGRKMGLWEACESHEECREGLVCHWDYGAIIIGRVCQESCETHEDCSNYRTCEKREYRGESYQVCLNLSGCNRSLDCPEGYDCYLMPNGGFQCMPIPEVDGDEEEDTGEIENVNECEVSADCDFTEYCDISMHVCVSDEPMEDGDISTEGEESEELIGEDDERE